MGKPIEHICETCLQWLPMGGCAIGGDTPCNEWQQSQSYPMSEPTLF
nr:MAG TPA: hypothetical protein [Caudoviricetes sp.]